MIAVFNNEINYLVTKPHDLKRVTLKEKSVTQGASIFDERMMGMPLVTDECIGAILDYYVDDAAHRLLIDTVPT